MSNDSILYAVRLEDAARRSFHQWGRACTLHGDAETEFTPNPAEVSRLARRCDIHAERFRALQTRLASLLGIAPYSVYNALSDGRTLTYRLPINYLESLPLAA